METFKDRLEKVIQEKELNPNKLSKILDVEPMNIYAFISGRSKAPSMELLVKFKTKLGIDINWLATGEGEMFTEQVKPNTDGGTMLETIKESYERQIELLNGQLNSLKYVVKLQSKMLGEEVNFNKPIIKKTKIAPTGKIIPFRSEIEKELVAA